MAEHCIKTINRSGIVKDMFGIRKKVSGTCIDLLNEPSSRGYEYWQRYRDYLGFPYREKHIPKANNEYNQAITCEIISNTPSVTIIIGEKNPAKIKSNLELVEKAYIKLKEKKTPSKKEVVDTAATMQWLIAQETPYMRGSDSVANLLSRSLLHSYGIKLSPLKAGVSCDFEAFYKDLDAYKKIYPTLFEENPLG